MDESRVVVVVQRFLPHYRIPVFELISSHLARIGWSLRVIHCLTMGKVPETIPWAIRIPSWSAGIEFRRQNLQETAVFSPFLASTLGRLSPRILVIEDVAGFPNSLVAAVWARLHGVPYLVWGLGRIPHNPPSRARKVLGPVIRQFYRQSHGFLCYSTHAQREYAQYCRPTHLVPNSVMPQPRADQVDELLRHRRSLLQKDGLRLFSIGVLKPQKCYDELLRVLGGITDVSWSLDLIGAGPELGALQEQARALGIGERVVFHGEVFDGETKQRIMRSCHIGVLPGRGGLAVQEMMANGLPVIAGAADGTELDLITNEVNGFVTDQLLDGDMLKNMIRHAAALAREKLLHMGDAALDSIRRHGHIGCMARGFIVGISSLRIPVPLLGRRRS
jgi:glycosyltransferase involved in cell wall biosynthesis